MKKKTDFMIFAHRSEVISPKLNLMILFQHLDLIFKQNEKKKLRFEINSSMHSKMILSAHKYAYPLALINLTNRWCLNYLSIK